MFSWHHSVMKGAVFQRSAAPGADRIADPPPARSSEPKQSTRRPMGGDFEAIASSRAAVCSELTTRSLLANAFAFMSTSLRAFGSVMGFWVDVSYGPPGCVKG